MVPLVSWGFSLVHSPLAIRRDAPFGGLSFEVGCYAGGVGDVIECFVACAGHCST